MDNEVVKSDQDHLDGDDEPEARLKAEFGGLVAEEVHSLQGAQATPAVRQRQKEHLRKADTPFAGDAFIVTVSQEGDQVDGKEPGE